MSKISKIVNLKLLVSWLMTSKPYVGPTPRSSSLVTSFENSLVFFLTSTMEIVKVCCHRIRSSLPFALCPELLHCDSTCIHISTSLSNIIMVALNISKRASPTCCNTKSVCLSHPVIPEYINPNAIKSCANAIEHFARSSNPIQNRSPTATPSSTNSSRNGGQIVFFGGLAVIITVIILISICCTRPRRRPVRVRQDSERGRGFLRTGSTASAHRQGVPFWKTSWVGRGANVEIGRVSPQRTLPDRVPRPYRVARPTRVVDTTSRAAVSPFDVTRPTARDMLASAHTPQRSSPRDVERDIPLRFGDGAVETGIYTPTDAYGVNRAYVTLPVVYSPRPSLERSERRESWEGRPRDRKSVV